MRPGLSRGKRTLQEVSDNYSSGVRSSERSPTLCSHTAISQCHHYGKKENHRPESNKKAFFFYTLLQLGQADTFQRDFSKNREKTQLK